MSEPPHARPPEFLVPSRNPDLQSTPAPEPRETPFYGIPTVPEPGAAKGLNRKPRRSFADAAPGGLSEEQVAEYRQRLARGFYASPTVVREVARRLLESGDI